MANIFWAIIFGLLWGVNLVNGTGLNAVYDITGKLKLIVLVFACLKIVIEAKNRTRMLEKNDFFCYGGMTALFTVSGVLNGYGFEAFDYLWVFILVYLLSDISINDRLLFYISAGYCAAGLFVLYVYNFQTVLDGWNENSIAMLALHSFLVFLIPFFGAKSLKNKALVVIITICCAKMLDITDSRSGMLFLFLGMLFALGVIQGTVVCGTRTRMVLFLLVPLIVAIVVVTLSHSDYFFALERWSLETFEKPIFNGRDSLWKKGFEDLLQKPLLGTGSSVTRNWHNSAVACLAGYGLLGYCVWLSAFERIFNKVSVYLEDSRIQGCIVCFMVLYAQQSVELGFISNSPSILPYVMLGLLLGRAKYLREEELDEEYQYYHSNL